MEIDQDTIRDVLQEFQKRCERVRAMGGLPLRDVVAGAPVPDGWVFDEPTQFYIPRPLDAVIN